MIDLIPDLKIKLSIQLQYEIAGRLQDVAFFDTRNIAGEHPEVHGAYIVHLPAMKTEVGRTVYISADLKQKLAAFPPGRLHPDIDDTHILECRLNRAFNKYLKGFDPRGPIRSHSFRTSKATHLA